MKYWEENGNHYSLPKEDAQKLAKACVQYDQNPKQRFVEMVESSTTYGSLLGEAFHYYDPDARRFTDSPETINIAGEPKQLTHAERLFFQMIVRQDTPNANFLERVIGGSSSNASAH